MKKVLHKSGDTSRKSVNVYAACSCTFNTTSCNPCSGTPSSNFINRRDSLAAQALAKKSSGI